MTTPFVRPELVPALDELHLLRRVANGTAAADLVIRGGRVLSVHTGELLDRDVIVSGRHIAAVTPVGRFEAQQVIDARGLVVAPTFIDAHLHIEYTMLPPGELGRLVVPKGTTAVLADPNCIANVLGARGMDWAGQTGGPLRIFQQVTPATPAFSGLERGGAVVGNDEVLRRIGLSESVALGESNPFDLGRESTNRYREALLAGRRITGHTARLRDEPLWSYLAAGVSDDHNAVTVEEVLERVRLGAMLTVMAGSMNDNTETVFADLDALRPAFSHICFCADDKHVGDLADQGHIDHHVRQAIRLGVEPPAAYRMASLNPALYYRIDHLIGAVAPSRLADLQLIGDLADVRPELVLVGGQVAAEGGRPRFANDDPIPDWTRETIHLHPGLSAASFAVRAESSSWVQSMEMYDGYFKRAFHAELHVEEGVLVGDPARDIAKIAVVDRHHASETVSVGFVRGFGLVRGALAVSTNCTNQNIVVVGVDDHDIFRAVREVQALGGGYVVADGDEIIAAVPLPIAGIMSDKPWETVYDELSEANRAAAGLGCGIHSPFMILAFVGLPGVPDLGLTELGLIDTASQQFIPVVLDVPGTTAACRCPSHAHAIHHLMDPATATPGLARSAS
jgi:adenine deaminase